MAFRATKPGSVEELPGFTWPQTVLASPGVLPRGANHARGYHRWICIILKRVGAEEESVPTISAISFHDRPTWTRSVSKLCS